jgi:hypothetical protein
VVSSLISNLPLLDILFVILNIFLHHFENLYSFFFFQLFLLFLIFFILSSFFFYIFSFFLNFIFIIIFLFLCGSHLILNAISELLGFLCSDLFLFFDFLIFMMRSILVKKAPKLFIFLRVIRFPLEFGLTG